MADRNNEIIVLGAGLTGLSFGYHAKEKVTIFEKEEVIGGLTRSIKYKDCYFDFAPHLLHLHSEYVKELVFEKLKVKAKEFTRNAKIFFRNKVILYPFEYSLSKLDEKIRNDCLNGLKSVTGIDENFYSNYEEYALKCFGYGISNHYLLPYNKKIWDIEPSKMTTEWLRYLPKPDIDKIKFYLTHDENSEFGYNSRFYYPISNGIQELPNSFNQFVKEVHLNHEVSEINSTSKEILFRNGYKRKYTRLVSTIPLNNLISVLDVPDLKKHINKLKYTTVNCVNIVFKGTIPEDLHWMYFPEIEYDFYRISFPKNVFNRAAGDGIQILSIEVGKQDKKALNEVDVNRIIYQVQNLGIFKIEKILFNYIVNIPVAYCIYDFERTSIVNQIKNELEKIQIYTTGRYGEWEYSAMEDAILKGKVLAEKLTF